MDFKAALKNRIYQEVLTHNNIKETYSKLLL